MSIKPKLLTSDEIRKIRLTAGLSQLEASKLIDVHRSTWWRWEDKGEPVSDKYIQAIRNLAELAEAKTFKPKQPDAVLPIYSLRTSEKIEMRRVKDDDATGSIGLCKEYLYGHLGVMAKNLIAFIISDTSMEPNFRNGDVVLVSNQGDAPVTQDGVYLIRIDGMFNYKRLVKLPGKKFALSSDNSSVPPYQINPADMPDFEVFGRVVAVLHKL